MEQALVRAADLAFTQKSYEKASEYFEQLRSVTGNSEVKAAAQLGVLRCEYQLQNHEQVIDAASLILRQNPDVMREREAYYCRAKALVALNDNQQAIPDLEKISNDVSNEMGAEAKFLLAEIYFKQKNYEKAEDEIVDFINKKSPFQYWVARSFVLLADIYIAQDDDFQAKQYLLSLQENYKQNDDISAMISARLNAISKRENERVH